MGEVLNALARAGLAEDTLVIFTSDNGPTSLELWKAEMKAHDMTAGLRGEKGEVYEGGVRVPLVARWPGVVTAGSESDALVSLLDFPATLAALAGQEVPEAFEDSFSFAHILQGESPNEPTRSLVIHNCPHTGDFAIQQGDWKLVLRKAGEPELYNLSQDQAETNDLSTEYKEVVTELLQLFEVCKLRGTRILAGS